MGDLKNTLDTVGTYIYVACAVIAVVVIVYGYLNLKEGFSSSFFIAMIL